MSNLNLNLSLLAINLNEVKRRIEKHPWIRSVELGKRFPHTLVIRAKKERPYAVVFTDKFYYMDQSGRLFKEVDPTDSVDYPVITGIAPETGERADRLKLAAHLLRILEVQKKPWSLEDISEIHLMDAENVALYFLALPAVVKLNGWEIDKRLSELKKVVQHLDRTGRITSVKGINLYYRGGAVVSFKERQASRRQSRNLTTSHKALASLSKLRLERAHG